MLLGQLQVSHVGCVLLARVIQLAALAQRLVVDRQPHGLYVHELVVGDGGLVEEVEIGLLVGMGGVENEERDRGRRVFLGLTERRVWSLCLMRSCSCRSTVTLVCSRSSC